MPAVDCSSAWSREEDKKFEKAIATYPESCSDRWEKIAADVGGKSVDEIKLHYELLVDDVKRIESGFVQVPCYNSSSDGDDHGTAKKGADSKASRSDQERRKGIAWTEDEHRLFLLGLDKYGKGDWRSISRNFVVTRTPTQVASHAQKYFIRLNSINKDRRRSSIHDITTVNTRDAAVPITGQTTTTTTTKSNKQGPHVSIGQPVGGPLVSAVGTPVALAPPPHLAYAVPGAPMMTYPMPHR